MSEVKKQRMEAITFSGSNKGMTKSGKSGGKSKKTKAKKDVKAEQG